MTKQIGGYDADAELAKGARVTAVSFDKTQKITVTADKVTVGGKAGELEISGVATGKLGPGIDGTVNIWLAIFRYMRPDGSVNHVAGWNIPLSLTPGQTAEAAAKAFADHINGGNRPYAASAEKSKIRITYKERGKT
jgi:hypothetical protein